MTIISRTTKRSAQLKTMKAACAGQGVCRDVHLQKPLVIVMLFIKMRYVRYENRP